LAAETKFPYFVAARYCGSAREAAALPGRFLPELGRFGNEAAIFYSAQVFWPLRASHVLTCWRSLRAMLLLRNQNPSR
ncbi:MAG: hypothetical protein ABI963_10365, partial [Rhizomicrobium sp.]